MPTRRNPDEKGNTMAQGRYDQKTPNQRRPAMAKQKGEKTGYTGRTP